MDLGLSGRVVVVTGGASNIGRAIALKFAEEHAAVAIVDFDKAQASATASQISAGGGRVLTYHADVTNLGAVSEAMAGVIADFGTVDVLVNNVGWSGRLGYFLTIEPERWDKAYQLNLRSTFNMTREVLPTMVAAKRGAIVSIASDAGFGITHVSEYGAMKAGVMAFSRSIAIEYGRYGIRSNAVAPGIVMPAPEDIGAGSFWNKGIGYGEKEIKALEAQCPMRIRPTAADVAAATVFLASEPAHALTGQVLSVSGGFTMPR